MFAVYALMIRLVPGSPRYLVFFVDINHMLVSSLMESFYVFKKMEKNLLVFLGLFACMALANQIQNNNNLTQHSSE